MALYPYSDTTKVFCGFTLLVLIVVPLVSAPFRRRSERRRQDRFVGREPLTSREVWERFYRESDVAMEDVEEAISVISKDTGVSTLLIRPSDRLGVELGLEGWEYPDEEPELDYWVDKRIKDAGRKVKFKSFETVDDVIRFSRSLRS